MVVGWVVKRMWVALRKLVERSGEAKGVNICLSKVWFKDVAEGWKSSTRRFERIFHAKLEGSFLYIVYRHCRTLRNAKCFALLRTKGFGSLAGRHSLYEGEPSEVYSEVRSTHDSIQRWCLRPDSDHCIPFQERGEEGLNDPIVDQATTWHLLKLQFVLSGLYCSTAVQANVRPSKHYTEPTLLLS